MRWTNAPLMVMIGLCLAFAPGTWSMASAQTPPTPGGGGTTGQTPEQLDKLTAPIALYPDALILQIVQCAASPYQVKQVDTWVKANPDLKGSALQDAASQQGFDASFVAIVLFPQVLSMMAEKPEWTATLGKAFGSNRDAVFASIQRLRTQAKSVGNLTSNEQQKVETVATSSGQQVIVIQPANPQVVYVPQYDPQVVYVQTAPPPAPVTTSNNSGQVVAAGLIGFAAGVIVGAAVDDDDDHYYYACGGWGYRGPALCSDGWNDYYQHRENMANDYYQHRENMASQRGENQSGRKDNRTENQGGRQDNRTENQGGRQDNRTENQGGRQDNRTENQGGRQDNRTQNQDGRAQNQSGRQDSRAETQAGRGGAAAQGQETRQSGRGEGQAGQRTAERSPKSTGEQRGSGAFSGYQRGETERQSSSRGRQSSSRSGSSGSSGRSGGSSRSGGGGGGRSGGGRR